MKYTTKELQEFKKLIEKKLQSAMEAYNLLSDEISKKDNSASDTNWQFDPLNDGSLAQSQEEKNIVASKQLKYIESLKNALIRIQNKTYGICRISGEIIPKNRLLAVPHATTTINAKNQ